MSIRTSSAEGATVGIDRRSGATSFCNLSKSLFQFGIYADALELNATSRNTSTAFGEVQRT